MSTQVVMEALSPTMEEGRLVEWKKQEGEAVAAGDVLAEVETDKAVMELVARVSGVLLRQTVKAGQTVPVSTPVALIGEPGEPVPAAAGNGAEAGRRAGAEAGRRAGGQAGSNAPPSGAAAAAPEPARPPAPVPAPGGRVKASPLARRIAEEQGLDLRGIQGSGPEGRIVLRDLDRARPAAPPSLPAPAPGAAPVVPAGAPYTDVPLTQMRKTIARRLVQSIGPVPTFYLTTEADMERVWEAREAMLQGGRRAGGQADSEIKVSFNDIIIKAVASALRQHPACNAWWQDDHIRYWAEVHVGMAVAIEDGLITPVIRHADRKSLREIASEARDMAGRARERRLTPDEYTGATFSMSNLGMLDIEEFTAVINPPETGILAVGRIVPKPVEHQGQLALRRRMRLTMSCDHRVIDGATGARFLQTLKAMLENPLGLVW
ncbi:MAG TPA: dihydrolipoamide acetyltransferase family protein [Gemmatimonadales bacterium]|nr:dihydrolipoamide acetyltransferase family protein [Gemmatimonadales bacterium]